MFFRLLRRRLYRMDKDLRAIIHLGLAFMVIFSAFNCQGFVEISYLRGIANERPSSGISEKSGYYSLAIVYLVFTISNLFAPPIIHVLGSKWAMVVGGSTYVLFMLGFLYLFATGLYLLSALAGFGAAILWTGQGAYMVAWSRVDTVTRNSGVTWALLQCCLLFGGLFFFGTLISSSLVSSFRLLYLVFSCLCAAGVIFLALLPRAPSVNEISDDDEANLVGNESIERARNTHFSSLSNLWTWKDEFRNTMRLFATRRMLLLSVVFLFSGFELTFFSSVYSTCLISFEALKDEQGIIIAYNAFLLGVGQILGGLLFGVFSRRKFLSGRNSVIVIATISHLTAFFLIFLNIPMKAPLHKTAEHGYIAPSYTIALVCSFLLGFADSCWNTQIYSLLGCLYSINSSNAFALFKFFQSLAASISFFYGSSLLLHWQLGIMAIFAVIAALGFFPVEWEAVAISVPPVSS